MQYAINHTSQEPIFLINDHIGDSDEDGIGIDGNLFAKEFFEVDGLAPQLITYYTNSWGGDVKKGLSMFSSIANAKSKTRSVISGFAYSTAGWIALAADEVLMDKHSEWMCHLVTSENSGSDLLNRVGKMVAIVISTKSGRNGKPKKSTEDILELMKSETVWNADQMKEEGLIDNIVDYSIPQAIGDFKNKVRSTKIFLNTYVKKQQNMFPTLLNKLGLAEGSSEKDMLTALASFENKVTFANAEVADLKNQLKLKNESQEELKSRMNKMQNEMDTMSTDMSNKKKEFDNLKNEYDNMCSKTDVFQNEFNALKAEKEAVEAKRISDRAETFYNQMVATGRLKDDEESKRVAMLKLTNDFEGTKLLMEMMPVNMKLPAPKFENKDLGLDLNAKDEDFVKMNREARKKVA